MRKTLHTFLAAGTLFLTAPASATILNFNVTSSNTFTTSSSTTVNVGDTIIWTLTGGSHNVTGCSIPSGAASFGSSSPMGSTYTYIPNVPGNYVYYCSFHGSCSGGTASGMSGQFTVAGCTGPATPTITSSNGNAACQGASVNMSVPAQAGATFQWNNNFVAVSGATTNSLNATTGGNYKVKVSRCLLNDSSAAFTATINPLPTPAFTISGGGATRTFTNTTVGTGMTFAWDFGDGQTSTAPNPPAHTYTTAGAKIVKLKATITATTCNTTTQQTVNVTLGVATIGNSESFTIVPNPATAVISIRSASGKIPALTLMDFAGRTVHAPITGNGKDQQVNVQSLPAGLYLLRLTTENGSAVEKITVMH